MNMLLAIKKNNITYFLLLLLINSSFVHASILTINSDFKRCKIHLSNNDLTSGNSGNALNCYQQILIRDPGNSKALEGIKIIQQRFINWAHKAIKQANKKKLFEHISKLKLINPKNPYLPSLQTSYQQLTEKKLTGTERCNSFMQSNDLTSGKNGNAVQCFQNILSKNPHNKFALDALKRIELRFLNWSKRAIRRGDIHKLEEYINKLSHINPKSITYHKLLDDYYTLIANKQKKLHSKNRIPAPIIQLIGDTNGDGVFNRAEIAAGEPQTIKANITLLQLAMGDSIIVNAKKYLLTESDINKGSIEVEIFPHQKLSTNIVTATGNLSTTASITIVQDISVTPGDINIQPITADNIINSAESKQNINISGTAQGGDISVGDKLQLWLKDQSYQTIV
ncbi:MAG: hypothetical protein QM479_13885, partial [Pseudomonadota bacterium]